jgi:hypothetical protein
LTASLTAALVLPAHAADPHPDLSGIWANAIPQAPGAFKREAAGTAEFAKPARGLAAASGITGALPSTPAPVYKPEFRAKVADLFDHESKTDPVFYCAQPGLPRIGPPRKIIQSVNEFVFLYEDPSGDPYRVIPVVGKAAASGTHRANANPSSYGDSVAYWDGGTLVVDVTSFVDDTWFGEGGYFHTDALHVTERFWRSGENLAYQVTVDDPKVLAAPWTMPVRAVKPSAEALEESPRCVEDDGHRLLNNDHHIQR